MTGTQVSALMVFLAGAVILVVTMIAIDIIGTLVRRSRPGWLRRLAFGWVCWLRGVHLASKPARILPLFHAGQVAAGPIGANAEFHCLCGATKYVTVDYQRGGRIPVPLAWPLEQKHEPAQTAR